jgi:murein DD-endopeptidase MepM/ murein hydrolase activator NlpD
MIVQLRLIMAAIAGVGAGPLLAGDLPQRDARTPVSLAASAAPSELGAMVSSEEGEPAPGISFGRALDIEGKPVRLASLSRTRPGLGFRSTYKGPFSLPSGSPLRRAYISSGFGGRVHPILGGARFHAGLDLAAPMGSPVYATSPGQVVTAGWCGAYGYCVIIDHGQGFATLFGHLSAIDVATDQIVPGGSLIGRVGSTGRSTGPHLHYEVRQNGSAIDPRKFL